MVNAADREAELILSEGLLDLLPGSKVLGEEACSTRPTLIEELKNEARLWVVDPVDGTANYVAGIPCFAVMVARLDFGETVASWILDPVTDSLVAAERSAGAVLDGDRLCTDPSPRAFGEMRGAVITTFLPIAMRSDLERRAARLGSVVPGLRCAGHEYPALARGDQHFSLFWRTLPWDHAPGALMLTEAGGKVVRPDGSAYYPLDGRFGLIAAQNPDIWEAVAAGLFRD